MAAKKRKASGRQSSGKKPDSAMRTKYSINETFDNSEDEFMAGRDQVLLEEGPEAKRRRKIQEEEVDFQPSDEEVLGYDEDEDELDEDEDEYENDYTSRKRKGGLDSESDAGANDEDEEEEGLEAWGSSRKDYYNADMIETEADALEEENEAKRLQQKHLKAMKEADFGFDELDWVESGKGAEDSKDGQDGVVTEVLPQLEITDDMSSEEKLKVLKSRYPEFEPLAKDFVDLQPEYTNILSEAQKAEEAMDGSETSVPVPIIKFRALASYLGSISMYFALLTSPAEDGDGKTVALSPAELRDHPIMGSLVKSRKQWETVKDWSIPDEVEDIEEDLEIEDSEESAELEPVVQLKEKKSTKSVQKDKKLSKSQQAAEKARAEAEACRAEKIKKTEANLADLADLVKTSSKKSKALSKTTSQPQEDDDSDLGDEGALTAREAEEKARKKRSLRFYTSQIAQKANKRNAAGRNAGGDEDLPYRERLKDRQARLNAEAERRGRAQANETEQLGGDSDEEDHRLAREVRGDAAGTDDDEYYDMVAARNKQKKADKKARAEEAEAAQKGERYEEVEEVGPDGKRRITYQIEKNKGLAAKRNKDVRNPRVKKRKKFEQKKKKLASIRQVYKGGEGRGGYAGELTGIKKNLVKSVKL